MCEKHSEKKNFQRMCVICRNRFDKSSLTRLVVKDGKVIVDMLAREPGRGAYVCASNDCRNNLIQKKALARVFKKEVTREEYSEIAESLDATIQR